MKDLEGDLEDTANGQFSLRWLISDQLKKQKT